MMSYHCWLIDHKMDRNRWTDHRCVSRCVILNCIGLIDSYTHDDDDESVQESAQERIHDHFQS